MNIFVKSESCAMAGHVVGVTEDPNGDDQGNHDDLAEDGDLERFEGEPEELEADARRMVAFNGAGNQAFKRKCGRAILAELAHRGYITSGEEPAE